ncbi:MAG: hypothetical protein HYU58_16590 [Proteobacteria bacterium]|nr:hypothetical protein [Pseudomonadota bacterium]
MARILAALLSGLVFGAGLALSGMSNPAKVLGFLDLGAIPAGGWDPSLAFVMGGALAVALPGFAWLRRQQQSGARPVVADGFHWPAAQGLDIRLILGSAIFGMGWGLAGICPGPALTLLVLAPQTGVIFVAAMIVGMAGYVLTTKR